MTSLSALQPKARAIVVRALEVQYVIMDKLIRGNAVLENILNPETPFVNCVFPGTLFVML